MKKFLMAALATAACFGVADAAPANSVDAHTAAAKKAGGLDFQPLVSTLCLQPTNGLDPDVAGPRPNAAARPVPARDTWYAEPYKVYDNLYFLGSKVNSAWALKTSAGIILIDTLHNYSVGPEIVDGMKKMGLNPADVKYVIINHGHGDHDEGAKLFQDKYGAHVVMGGPDWDSVIKENNTVGGVPKRDISPTNGQKITVGDTTVTIYLTPGHTPGTLSEIFPVKDKGKTEIVAYSGGTAFNFPRTPANFQAYAQTQDNFAKIAAGAGATVLISNHSEWDNAYDKARMLADRRAGEANPFTIGKSAIARYFTMTRECALAEAARLAPGA